MYCPDCGKENSAEQKFCRSCGFGLQLVSRALAGELAVPASHGDTLEPRKHAQKGWLHPLLYGFMLVLLGMVIVIIGRKIFGEVMVADIGTLISILGIGLLGFKGVQLIRGQPTETSQLPEAATKPELTSRAQPALRAGETPSVTEHTTRHLEPVYNKRKAD
ncbi:MAG TPA: zinc-ribbon domain-containing protein [Pyrinomonadaceae bacterium]|jgi:hypothetical protein